MGTRYFKHDIVIARGEFWTITSVTDKSSDSPDYHLSRFSDRDGKETGDIVNASELEKLKPKGGWKQARKFARGQKRQNRKNRSSNKRILGAFSRDWGNGDFGKAYLTIEVDSRTLAADLIYHKPTASGRERQRVESGMSPKLALQVALRFMEANNDGHKTFSVSKDSDEEYSFEDLVENEMNK